MDELLLPPVGIPAFVVPGTLEVFLLMYELCERAEQTILFFQMDEGFAFDRSHKGTNEAYAGDECDRGDEDAYVFLHVIH